jgi:hypothetical protein
MRVRRVAHVARRQQRAQTRPSRVGAGLGPPVVRGEGPRCLVEAGEVPERSKLAVPVGSGSVAAVGIVSIVSAERRASRGHVSVIPIALAGGVVVVAAVVASVVFHILGRHHGLPVGAIVGQILSFTESVVVVKKSRPRRRRRRILLRVLRMLR